jgi:hypothetical protein
MALFVSDFDQELCHSLCLRPKFSSLVPGDRVGIWYQV